MERLETVHSIESKVFIVLATVQNGLACWESQSGMYAQVRLSTVGSGVLWLLGPRGQHYRGGKPIHTQRWDVYLVVAIGGKLE